MVGQMKFKLIFGSQKVEIGLSEQSPPSEETLG